jgi:outer membrane protein assembly factor BamB
MEVKSKIKLPAEVFSSPTAVESTVYIGCRDDRLYALQL